jgi:hypothetical protein
MIVFNEFFRDNGKYHPHIHMLIYTSKKRSQIIKELSSKTKIPTLLEVNLAIGVAIELLDDAS